MWRNVAAAAILAAGAALIYRICIVPYRCSQVEMQTETRMERALRYPDTTFARELASQNLTRLQDCLEADPTNVNLYMLAAANERILRHDAAAVALYQRALRYDRRPEIYLNLGVVQAATNDPDGAVQSLVMAGNFSGKDLLLELPDVATRMRAYAIVAKNEAALLASYGDVTRRTMILNPTFDKLGPGNPLTVDTTKPQPWSSAAEYWYVLGAEGTSILTEVVPSTRRGGGRMLHVVAPKGTILFQDFGSTSGQLSNALTDAWIYVRSGKVWVASGNGYATKPDAVNAATGRWERLQSRNGSCPATETRIGLLTERADFYVDSVNVYEVAGPVCGDAR
jgi:tetratricopeptide (TPR) repeat protein